MFIQFAVHLCLFTEFFTGDLSALIHMVISLNMRPDKTTTQKKAMELVENTLKGKFPTVKCHMIGSHAYSIAKGGLVPLDIYLDLCELHNCIQKICGFLSSLYCVLFLLTDDSFHKDKAGSVFIDGMNETQKLLTQSGEWRDAKRTEQTRYAILSAVHANTSLQCNFSFGTGVQVRNTEVLSSLFAAQPVGMCPFSSSKINPCGKVSNKIHSL